MKRNGEKLETRDQRPVRVLAIDPGYERLGIAVLEKGPTGEPRLLHSECFMTEKSVVFSERLLSIGERLKERISKHSPTHLAMELLYLTKNQKTAMHVAEVRGLVLYLAAEAHITICEYTPSEVKIAVTGDGRADKKQVIFMVPKLVTIKKPIRYDDEHDAIAVGLTCLAVLR